MGKAKFTVKRLDDFQKWLLKNSDQASIDGMKDRILRTTGLRMQEYLDDLTPRRFGALQNSMRMGDPNNVFEIKVGSKSYLTVGTNIEYAVYVNDGFTQEAGRFVPGEWRSGNFHYIPGHNEGMVLKGATIEGAYFFDKAVQYTEEDIPDIVDFEFRRLYADLF